MEKRIIVTVFDGLYYRLEVEEMHKGEWKKATANFMYHENQLSEKIADIMRGPSCFAR